MAVTIFKRNTHGNDLIWYNPNNKPEQKNYVTSSQYLIDLGIWESELIQIPYKSSQDEKLIYDYCAKTLGYYKITYQNIFAYETALKRGIEVDFVKVIKEFNGANYSRLIAKFEPIIYPRLIPEYFDDVFKKYREYTNNEDAYCFKEWLKENYEYLIPRQKK
jgi:hypothetical protein